MRARVPGWLRPGVTVRLPEEERSFPEERGRVLRVCEEEGNEGCVEVEWEVEKKFLGPTGPRTTRYYVRAITTWEGLEADGPNPPEEEP